MQDEDGYTWHTYRAAAKRVGRCNRTIMNWRRWGMPMEWRIIEGQRTRVVREDILLQHFRLHLTQSPVHQYRMRALRLLGAFDPPIARPPAPIA